MNTDNIENTEIEATEAEAAVQEQQNERQLTVGQILKTHREQASLTLEAIAKPLRLSALQIQYLENDEYNQLGPITFVKGYIKNYCRELDIDSAPLLAMMPAPPEPTKPENMQSFSRRTEKEAHDSRLMLVSYLILTIVIGSSAVWFWQNARTIEEQTNTINASNSMMSERQAIQPNNVEPEIEVAQQDTPPKSTLSLSNEITQAPLSENNDAVPVSENNDVEPVVEAQPAQVVETPAPVNHTIVMNFTGDSWVEVHDGKGERIAVGVKSAGYEMNLNGTPPFSIVLGKHEVVSMTYEGKDIDLSRFAKNRLAKFKLPLAE